MPTKTLQIRNSTAEFLIFTKQASEDSIEVRLQDGTIWLSQKLMAVLFDCTTENVIMHLKNIFAEGEQDEISVTKGFVEAYLHVNIATGLLSKVRAVYRQA